MSNAIAISIDGPGAREALDEFFAIAGIVGEPRATEQPRVVTRDGGVLGAVGTIVGIVSGIAPVVANIIKWYAKRKQENQRFHVVVEDAQGNRISLDDATPEQIASALQTLQS